MGLHADEPGVVGIFDHLGQLAVGRHTGKAQARLFQLLAIGRVHFIAVAVAVLDFDSTAVNLADPRIRGQDGGIGTQPHGAAFVVRHLALHGIIALHPFLEVIDDRREAGLAGFVVELLGSRVGHSGQVAGGLDHRHLHSQTDAQIGHLLLARVFGGGQHPFGPAFAKPAGHDDAVVSVQQMRAFAFQLFAVHPVGTHAHAVGHAAMGQRLGDGFVGVLKLGVFPHDRDVHLALGVLQPVHHVLPFREIRTRGGADGKGVQNGAVQPRAMIGQRRLVDGLQVIGRDHGVRADVAEQRDLGTFLFRDGVFGPADQHIGGQTDGLQFLDAVLGGLGLQFARCRKIGQQRQVHQDALAARAFMGELADRLEEGQALDVAHRAADLAQHEIDLVVADGKEILDLVRDVGDHLDGLAQVFAPPFLFQHVGINAAAADAVGAARGNAGEAFVMAQVQVGFRAVVSDEHLAMFKGRHGAGIDVQIGVKLTQPDREAPCLQQRAQCRRSQALAKRRHDAAGDEDVTRHEGPRDFANSEWLRTVGQPASRDPGYSRFAPWPQGTAS